MKKTSIFILTIVLLGLGSNLSATSPMPEEVKSGQNESVCTIHVVYMPDGGKEIPGKEFSSSLTFGALMPEKDVLEKVTRHVSDKLNEGNVSEFKVECKFPKK